MIIKIKNFIKTIIFLNQIRTKYYFILLYIYFKFKRILFKFFFRNIFLKNQNIIEKYYEKKKFKYGNFFFLNSLNIHQILKNYNLIENQKYLEIGSFEGSSVVYFSKVLKNSSFCCVDIWTGVEELSNIDFREVERSFLNNISDISKDNISICKQTSREFFKKNLNKFSIIYIDGNHSYDEVLNDLNECFKILVKGGIIILDDYIWSWYKDPKKNPGYAINIFLKNNFNKIKVLSMTEQVIIKKL